MPIYHIGCGAECPNLRGAYGDSAQGSRVTMRFLRTALLYDIRNCAFVEGEVMGEGMQHGQHTLVDIGEEGNIDRVTRVLDAAHAGVVELLYPYTKHEVAEEEIDDAARDTEEYIIELKLPASFSGTTVKLLSKLIHEYLVARVLADWLSITNAAASSHWAEKASEAAEAIKEAKNLRRGSMVRPMRPI